MRKLILLLFFLFLFLTTGKTLYLLKDGFSPRRILSLDELTVADWDEEISQALSQTFYYLGRGRQCFAFASKDGKYVLKLPRTDIYKTPFWARALPCSTYRKKLEAVHQKRKREIFESFRISLEELREQTGVLALHLGRSESKGKQIALVDKLGCKHTFPLEKTSFMLQYKRSLLIPAFLTARQKGDEREAKRILDALLKVMVERGEKGVLNQDSPTDFLRNYGFDGEKAYLIDVGSFYHIPDLDPKCLYQKSVGDSIAPVQKWLAKTDLEMLRYLNERLCTIALQ